MGDLGVIIREQEAGSVKGAQKWRGAWLESLEAQRNNKQDYKQELKKKLRKDGEMGKVQVGGIEGSL